MRTASPRRGFLRRPGPGPRPSPTAAPTAARSPAVRVSIATPPPRIKKSVGAFSGPPRRRDAPSRIRFPFFNFLNPEPSGLWRICGVQHGGRSLRPPLLFGAHARTARDVRSRGPAPFRATARMRNSPPTLTPDLEILIPPSAFSFNHPHRREVAKPGVDRRTGSGGVCPCLQRASALTCWPALFLFFFCVCIFILFWIQLPCKCKVIHDWVAGIPCLSTNPSPISLSPLPMPISICLPPQLLPEVQTLSFSTVVDCEVVDRVLHKIPDHFQHHLLDGGILLLWIPALP